jgi:hypothetical protein
MDRAYRALHLPGTGRVIDQAEGLVEVQGFVIETPLLSDEYVDFEISRLDLNR